MTAILGATQAVPFFPLQVVQACDTQGLLSSFRNSGLAPETMARLIDGTAHTGFLGDPRLSRKIVSVFATEREVLADPRAASETRDRLKGALQAFLLSGKTLDTQALLSLLNVLQNPETCSLLEEHNKDFVLEVVPGATFDDVVGRWGKMPGCRVSFYEKRGHLGLPDRLLLRELPPADLSGRDGWRRAVGELLDRILGAVHEWEHWRHFTGRFQGLEAGAEPFPIRRAGRNAVLASETMALLEEHRQRIRLLDFGISDHARSRGLTTALFLKDRAYEDYYAWRWTDRLFRGVARFLGAS